MKKDRHPKEEMRVDRRHGVLSRVGIWEEKQSRRMLNMLECVVLLGRSAVEPRG